MAIRSSRELVDEALGLVTTHDAAAALALLGQPDTCFVDLREPAERTREGTIPGAVAAPRGVIEFWFDPSSPWKRDELTRPGTRYVLFCAAGWRSALAARALIEMGVVNVSHVGGGLDAWKAAGGPVEP